MVKRSLGWTPDTPDRRDYVFEPKNMTRMPKEFDLRDRFFRCWQQGSLGSCTAQSVAAAVLFRDIYDRDHDIVVPSRLFIYYATRSLEGTTKVDAGAQIRNAIKAVSHFGYPLESSWPYRTANFTKKPPVRLYKAAEKEKIRRYERVKRDLRHFKSLLTQGLPIVIGFSVYESIYQQKVTKTGFIPLPKGREKLDGGHAVLVVGYSDSKNALVIRNSWGTSWGEAGYGYLPYDYILDADLSDDFWVVK